MNVKWKKNKNLKPIIILQKIDSITTITEDGKVSYSGFEFHDLMATLQNMLEFPPQTEVLHQESLTQKAIDNAAKAGDLSEKKVVEEINKIAREMLATKELKYHILTSISLANPPPAKRFKIEGCYIRIIDKDYPQKYVGRQQLISDRKVVLDGTPSSYAKVIISLKSRSPKGAATTGLRALDIQRAIWCLLGNSGKEFGGDEWQPINKVRLGGAHTVHKENGEIATETFWYEPNFIPAKLFKAQKPNIYNKNCKWAIKQLNKSNYSESLKEALLRYVRALDQRDQNVALIQLWGALESLASPSVANYDLVTRRCSFLFKEGEYHKQVLEHLREYRNRSVHAGDQNERAKSNCFQLQFYFHHLIMFHLYEADNFSTLEDANNFLDLPSNIDILNKKKAHIEKAINFVS